MDDKDELWIADWQCSRVVHIASMAGAGWSTVPADAPVALACDGDNSAVMVAAIGAKRINRHDAATGALSAATPGQRADRACGRADPRHEDRRPHPAALRPATVNDTRTRSRPRFTSPTSTSGARWGWWCGDATTAGAHI